MGRGKLQYVMLDELKKGRQEKRILFRIVRLWDTYNAQKINEMISKDFLILDEKGNIKHCVIRSKFIPNYHEYIEEGKYYIMKNFSLQPAKPNYRVVDEELQIVIDGSTHIDEVIEDLPEIPTHYFNFSSFDNIHKQAGDIRLLVDVIGIVIGISPVEQRIRMGRHVDLQMLTIKDQSGSQLRVTLWGALANTLNCVDTIESDKFQIVILTSMIMKNDNGQPSISSSSASKMYIDLEHPDVEEFQKLCEDKNNRESVTQMNIASTILTRDNYDANKRTLNELQVLIENGDEMDQPYYCNVNTIDIDTYNGWRYSACSECKRKLRVYGQKLGCEGCGRMEDYPEARYRVEIIVRDHTGEGRFVFFDRDVQKMIEIPASQLTQKVAEENIDDAIPAPLKKMLGKSYICQVKFNEQTRGSERESFTVNRTYEASEIIEKHDETMTLKNITTINVAVETPAQEERKKLSRTRSQKENDSFGGFHSTDEARKRKKKLSIDD